MRGSRAAWIRSMTCLRIVRPWHMRGAQWHTPRSCSPSSTRFAMAAAAAWRCSTEAEAVRPDGAMPAQAAASSTVARPCHTSSKPRQTVARCDSLSMRRKFPSIGCERSMRMSPGWGEKSRALALARMKCPAVAAGPCAGEGSATVEITSAMNCRPITEVGGKRMRSPYAAATPKTTSMRSRLPASVRILANPAQCAMKSRATALR